MPLARGPSNVAMNKLGLVAFGLVLCGLGGGVAAQQKGAEALQQAILREESERDDAAAARMYRSIAWDNEADLDVRVQAFERLVRLSRRTSAYERDRVELERLAGQIGEPATAVLARAGSQTKELEEHARRLVAEWQQHSSPPELVKTLVLIGQPAVPALAAEAEKLGVGRNQWPIMVIGKIGGEGADAFLARVAQSPDVLYRRGVLSVISDLDHDSTASLRPFLKRFLRDPDEQVRFLAVPIVARLLELQEQLPLLLDPSAKVSRRFCLGWHGASDAAIDVALRQLEQMRQSGDPAQEYAVLHQVGCILHGQAPRASEPLSAFVLACLPLLDEHRNWASHALPRPFPGGALLSTDGSPNYQFAAVPLESILTVAERLGPVRAGEGAAPLAAQLLLNLISASTGSWTAESIPGALRLAALGYDRMQLRGSVGLISGWLSYNATSESAAAIVGSLDHFVSQEGVLQRLNHVGWGTADASPLVRMLNLSMAAEPRGPLGALVEALLIIGNEESDRAVVEASRRSSAVFDHVAGQIAKHLIDRPRVLGPLLSVGPSDRYFAYRRDAIFKRVAEAGIEELIEELPKAYAAGLPRDKHDFQYVRRTTQGRGTYGVTGMPGVGHLVAASMEGQRFSSYDAEAVARIFELCAATDSESFWAHAIYLIRSAPTVGQPLVSWYAKHVGRFMRMGLGDAVVSTVLGASRDEAEREALIAWSFEHGSGDVINAAFAALRPLTEPKEKYVRAALRSEDPSNVISAIALLVDQRRDASLYDWLHELARHEDATVRQALAMQVVAVPDRRWIPLLLEMLRDPSDLVRTAAQASLEKLQFYFDQVERWERWQKGTTLDAPNAAEALLAQASPDQPKPKRLAAITSLGTLGVPETLPLLIEWMNDSDPDIAKAARDAVTRINERKR